ncbi:MULTISPECIES: ABC transporter ATP-binding protein [unclassified Streptomyces]|nr:MULTISPECIES: ABC transporter ATP-binding protein [unclassified Streptomyces]MYY86821.1 dipeptide ABC transporter ATP-binding protein [Streptomyces sp. SID335]MYZ16694.1 dipeptide ABC transporter ATP-binding protein [Streptomyces sp. SID337]NDZ99657.1 ABC transporter ATP-binding protein [Streptomyces sp. SID10116]NEB46035.1 ABC transporter ATP-binding protein [Streptomyces sp. SID339]
MTLTTTLHDDPSPVGVAAPVLAVRDLRISFPSEAGPVEAVRGVSFDLLPGRTLGIVGESGSGKSATAMGIMGLLPPTADVRGRVRLGDQELTGLDDRALSRIRGNSIGMVFQDPLSALTPIFSVGRLLSDALRVHQNLSAKAAREQAVELLDLVGIPDARSRAASFPHQFSGGMRQRVVIAMAIANRPRVLVADEPTTALDVTVQAQILDVLRLAQQETGAGLVLITHDLGVVAGHADDVAVMYAGRFVEKADVHELFRRPTMPYTARLLAAVPTVDGGVRRPLVPIGGEPPALSGLPDGCPFASRCAVALDACRAEEPGLRRVTGHGDVACLRAAEIADGTLDPARGVVPSGGEADPGRVAGGDVVLRVEDLVKTFPVTKGAFLKRRVGTLHAVNGVGFELRAGETLGLVGESGSGKTTTLMEILRLRRPEGGRIEVGGIEVGAAGAGVAAGSGGRGRTLRHDVQIVMQDPMGALDPRLTVHQLLAEPLRAVGSDRDAVRSRVHELLSLVGLGPAVSDRFPAALSGGQRQRIGIARALATDPKLLALDEPLSALDVSVQAGVINLLGRLKRELGLAYLMVAHDLAVVRYICDRIAVMYLGHIVESGDTETLFSDPKHPYTRALLSAIPIPDPERERTRERIVLDGEQPSATVLPRGCVFVDRCPLYRTADDEVRERCRTERPASRPVPGQRTHAYACHAA